MGLNKDIMSQSNSPTNSMDHQASVPHNAQGHQLQLDGVTEGSHAILGRMFLEACLLIELSLQTRSAFGPNLSFSVVCQPVDLCRLFQHRSL